MSDKPEPVKSRLKTLSLVTGASLIGPLTLGMTIHSFIRGELPFKRGRAVSVVQDPAAFYFYLAVFGIASLVLTYCSFMLLRAYFRSRR